MTAGEGRVLGWPLMGGREEAEGVGLSTPDPCLLSLGVLACALSLPSTSAGRALECFPADHGGALGAPDTQTHEAPHSLLCPT